MFTHFSWEHFSNANIYFAIISLEIRAQCTVSSLSERDTSILSRTLLKCFATKFIRVDTIIHTVTYSDWIEIADSGISTAARQLEIQ